MTLQQSDMESLAINVLKESEVTFHGFLPLAASYCKRLGLSQIVDSAVPSQMDISPGTVVLAMVLDTLSGRSPLYHVKHFLAGTDAELLLGEDLPAEKFNDTNIGRSMDAIFEAGPYNIITELGIAAVQQFKLEKRRVSYDTTSVSVWGEYSSCSEKEPPSGPKIVYGHSKDHRPDLKQFMLELLCVDHGVPIFGKALDGNSSDKTSSNEMLTRLSSLMARHGLGAGAFVSVFDSAGVTEANLNLLEGTPFISRLPATYSEHSRVIKEAFDSGEWVKLGTLSETPESVNRPSASYKVCEKNVTLYGKSYRSVVVHSSSHDKRRRKSLERKIKASAKEIEERLRELPLEYHCEADALVAAEKARSTSGKLHKVETSITTREIRKRGRPPKNKPHPTTTRYVLAWQAVVNESAVQREKEIAGCFVLLTNVPLEGENALDARGVLCNYKGQYAIESGFGFLKDPLIMNDIFLKSPQRIEVLMMVLIIALMIWRLMERSMRLYLANTDTTLQGWEERATKRPTTYMLTWVIRNIAVAKITQSKRVIIKPPNKRQIEFMNALGVSSEAFTQPGYRCKPVLP